MAAAAFKAVIILNGEDGWADDYPCTVSDVNAEYYVFPDGNNDVVLPGNHGRIIIKDIILSAAGTDTTRAYIFVNGKDTGRLVQNASNLGTVLSRQFQGCNMVLSPGCRLRLKQLT